MDNCCVYCTNRLRVLKTRIDWPGRKYHLLCKREANKDDIMKDNLEMYVKDLSEKNNKEFINIGAKELIERYKKMY